MHDLVFYSLCIISEIFSVKVWFMKISTRIVKYESQIVKSNPEIIFRINYLKYERKSSLKTTVDIKKEITSWKLII